jgi:hypothetical protein
MQRSSVLPTLGGVTGSAVHGRNVNGGVGKGEVLVAEGTADPGSTVNRGGQVFGGHQELGRTLHTLKHGRIPVAHEAHLILSLCPKGPPREEKSHEKEKRPSQIRSLHRRLTENPDNPDFVRVVQY